jgi:hypothetical protein
MDTTGPHIAEDSAKARASSCCRSLSRPLPLPKHTRTIKMRVQATVPVLCPEFRQARTLTSVLLPAGSGFSSPMPLYPSSKLPLHMLLSDDPLRPYPTLGFAPVPTVILTASFRPSSNATKACTLNEAIVLLTMRSCCVRGGGT